MLENGNRAFYYSQSKDRVSIYDMTSDIIGIIGAALILLGWIPETIKVIKDKKGRLDWKFAILYFIGSGLLVFYSVQIQNRVFIALNSLITLLEAAALIYSIKK